MNELFVAAILFVIVGTATAAGVAGLPMSLGAFVAGLLLAESEYRKAIETTIEPVQGLLLGIFFFTVGMTIDLRELAREPFLLAAAVIGVIALKASLLIGLARLFSVPWSAAIEMGCCSGRAVSSLSSVLALRRRWGSSASRRLSFTLAVTSLSMALIPLLSYGHRRLAAKVAAAKPRDPELAVEPKAVKGHAIVVGHGRLGRLSRKCSKGTSFHSSPSIVTRRR